MRQQITAIIFSRNRAMQLDLLLKSMQKYAPEMFSKAYVLDRADSEDHVKAYRQLQSEYADFENLFWVPRLAAHGEMAAQFQAMVTAAIGQAGEYVCFLCDDDVFYRQAPEPEMQGTCGFSWRLGKNTTWNYMGNRAQREDEGDFVYPFSVDGTVYWTEDVRHWMENCAPFHNPNSFEHFMNQGLVIPKLKYAVHSSLVGIPHNSVTEWPQGNRSAGNSAEELNRMFLDGYRIDLDQMDFSDVRGCHQEIPYAFKKLPVGAQQREGAEQATSGADAAPPYPEGRSCPMCRHGIADKQGDICNACKHKIAEKSRVTALLSAQAAERAHAASQVPVNEGPEKRHKQEKKPIFSILHTTARLPEGWVKAYEQAKRHADHWEDVEYILCIDKRDLKKPHPIRDSNIILVINHDRPCSVAGYNAAAPHAQGQIFIHAQDDVFFPPHWDTELLKAYYAFYPFGGRVPRDVATIRTDELDDFRLMFQLGDFNGREFVIHVSSGSPRDPFQMAPQIYSKARYEQLGYAFFPEYLGMYADNEFTEHAYHDNVVIQARHLLFEQRHPLLGHGDVPYDATYAHENSKESYKLGAEILDRRRKELGFSQADILNLTNAAATATSSDGRRRKTIRIFLPGEQFSQTWVSSLWALFIGLMERGYRVDLLFGHYSNVYGTRATFAANTDAGIETGQAQPADYVLLLDDDNTVTVEQLEILIADLDAHPEIAGVGGWCWTQFDGERAGHRISCGTLDEQGPSTAVHA